MTAEKNRLYFDSVADEWRDEISEKKKSRIGTICNTFLSNIESPVLDVGGGTGVLIPFLKYKYPLIELDVSGKMLSQARISHAESNSGIYFLQADALYSPLKANAFSSIICFQVYPHFDNKVAAAREFYRVLQTNGKLYIIHLMDHQQLNAMHSNAGNTVSDHKMISVVKLAELIVDEEFTG